MITAHALGYFNRAGEQMDIETFESQMESMEGRYNLVKIMRTRLNESQ